MNVDDRDQDYDEQDPARCPICDHDVAENGPCPHLVSNVDFPDCPGGWGLLDTTNSEWPGQLEEAIEALVSRAEELELEPEQVVLSVPEHLQALVRGSLSEACLDVGAAQDWFDVLIARCPTYVGQTEYETSGPPGWDVPCYWAKDAKVCTEAALKLIKLDITTIREAAEKCG